MYVITNTVIPLAYKRSYLLSKQVTIHKDFHGIYRHGSVDMYESQTRQPLVPHA